MGKGLNTKSGRMAQMIRHGANPNVFDPNGVRVVTANFDHDYSESYEFDTRRRRGVNGAYFNAVTDGMGEGSLEGSPCYNLMDDEILPYLLAKCVPADDVVANGKRERIYYWPQYDRADREFFAFEEGRPGSVLRGGFGMFTSFKLSSKTGKKSSLSVTIPFVTQAPTKVSEMTGASPQNGKFRVVANNVAGDLTLGIVAGALAKKNVTLPIGLSKAQIEAAFAAQGLTIVSTGTIAAGAGEVHRLIANNPTGNATIYDTIAVAPGMTAAALQTAVQAKGGNFANRTVTGGTTVGQAGGELTTGGTASASSTGPTSGPAAPFTAPGNTWASGQVPSVASPQFLAYDRGANKAAIPKSYSMQSRADDGYGTPQKAKNWKFQGSNDNATWDTLDEQNAPANFPTGVLTQFPLANVATKYRYFRILATATVGNDLLAINRLIVDSDAIPATGTYVISAPADAGDIADITPTPGAGWTTAVQPPGAAGGQIDFEVTNPTQTRVVVTKEAGNNNYLLSTQQQGGKGIAAAVAEPMPIEPGHLRFYHADTLAGLDAPAAYIGKISEFELDVPKLCEPHHFHNNTESGPITYSAHKEPEDLDIMLSVTLPTDENGDCAGLKDGTLDYVSKSGYWRIKAVCPIIGYEQQIEFYGSVGKSIPLTYNENVEERKFIFNLMENRVLPWNFRWKSRVPA